MSYDKRLINVSSLDTVKEVLDKMEVPYEIRNIHSFSFFTPYSLDEDTIRTLRAIVTDKFVLSEFLHSNGECDWDDYIRSKFITKEELDSPDFKPVVYENYEDDNDVDNEPMLGLDLSEGD